MSRYLRYLRIAFSATCLLACVLLIVLWVRSYSYWDELYNPISNKTLIVVESASGRVILESTGASPGSSPRCVGFEAGWLVASSGTCEASIASFHQHLLHRFRTLQIVRCDVRFFSWIFPQVEQF